MVSHTKKKSQDFYMGGTSVYARLGCKAKHAIQSMNRYKKC